MIDNALTTLKTILGADNVLSTPEQTASYLQERRGRFAGRRVAAVLTPGSTDEVAAAIRQCQAQQLNVIPQGGNTGLCGGAAALGDDPHSVILSLERLNKIRRLDAENFTITAEAGCRLSTLQEAATAADRLFPLSYAAERDCQIGGNLATNAGGMNVLRYGNARELALGLEVVLADGQIWHGLTGLRKDNSGYDLRDLFIGSEGTLGIITAATLKLFPALRCQATAIVGLASMADAVQLFSHLRQASGDTMTSAEVMSRQALGFAVDYAPNCHEPLPAAHHWYLLVELGSSAAAVDLSKRLERALADASDVGDYRVARSADEAADFWRLRNSIPDAQKGAGASIKNDISVPISALPAFIDAASAAIEQHCQGVRLCPFGHIGDGNLHFNLSQPKNMSAEQFLARWEELAGVVNDIVMRHHGSFAAEHGVGQLKPNEVSRLKDPVEQSLMRAIKSALDPEGRLNPGKVIPRYDD